MTSILGPYYAPWHWRATDMRYVSNLQPAWARIHQFNARSVSEVQDASRKTKIMLRSWDLDDHNGDRKREVYADPIGAAHRHADMWSAKLESLIEQLLREERYFDTGKWYIGLINEPDANFLPQIVQYTGEWLRISAKSSYPLGVGVSSVGTFAKPGESENSWDLFKPLQAAINDTGSVLMCHEYWQPEGPRLVWTDDQGRERRDAGNLAWRHHSIPLDVPILIGESGANGYIFNRHSNKDDSGWQAHADLGLTANAYAHQVREYIEGCDQRVEGVLLYLMDYHSDQWRSFDTEPAHDDLLRIAADARPQARFTAQTPAPGEPDTYIPVVTGPQTGPPPVVTRPPPGSGLSIRTVYVTAPAGLNVRDDADENATRITGLPYRAQIQVTEQRGDWLRMPGFGWVHGNYVSETEPPPAPPVVPRPQPNHVPPLIHPIAAPALRRISQPFGVNRERYEHFIVDGVALKGHNGVDYAVPSGTPVRAVAEGTVVEVANDVRGWGQYIKLRHPWGETIYAHLSVLIAVLGMQVNAGHVLGLSGNTGNSTGAHLHFGIRVSPFDRADGWGGFSDPLPHLQNLVASPPPEPPGSIAVIVSEAAAEFGVDEYLMLSLIWKESSYDPKAVNPNSQAKGLGQFLDATWAEQAPKVGATNVFDARDNARTSANYLRWLIQTAGSERRGLYGYVWGIGNVISGITPPAQVVEYANAILHGRDLLEAVIE